ncbi:MAG: DUF3416 domain-containing protein [Deltaproteobacteria bacterium]|nr:DUF3416 domain-containing protein [Deltaproteobacteria bacterium]
MHGLSEGGRRRVLVEGVSPDVDGGRYPAKRILGDRIFVECDLVSDGHDAIAGRVLFRLSGEDVWQTAPLMSIGNDRFRGELAIDRLGRWELTFEGFVDAFTTWRASTAKKIQAGQEVCVELLGGAALLAAGARRARATAHASSAFLDEVARVVADPSRDAGERWRSASSASVVAAMADVPDLANATLHDRVYPLVVDPPLARFSAWYELFPRSTGAPGVHGTLRDVEARLDYVASMGFDVLYLPPIHPIGRAFRKGPNNTLRAGPDDPGSPWAIGAEEGGHKAVHPELGTLDDLARLVTRAREKGIEIALDIAFQASPDHPYVKEHPEWFLHRADGTFQYAENPPKKYQDVYPFDFECGDWRGLWAELLSVFLFWCEQGVRVYRVDNPHTKALRFWEWCIAEVKSRHPEVVFLAEAFTRPKLMVALAKLGFTQSYTYFTWRHTKQDFETYLTELVRPPVRDFYRPSFWPNTPDILPEHLQHGGKPMFLLRMLLAATLSSSWGIYGPPFELMEHVARPGAEEYLDNEKYQLRTWNLDDPRSLRDAIALVNRARRENPALQQTERIRFHRTDNDAVMAFSKHTDDLSNVVLVVANLDVRHVHEAWIDLDLESLGIAPGEGYQVHDLLSAERVHWSTARAFVRLDPRHLPVSLYVVRRKVRSEHDFEYFL